MKQLSIVDVRNRIRNIPEGNLDLKRRDTFDEQAEVAIQSGFTSKIIFCIECAIGDSSHSMSESSMYNLFDALAEHGTVSQINKYGNLILKEYVNKTRDAKETQTYLKQKLGRVKGKMNAKNSLVNKNLNSITDMIQKSIDDIKSNLQTNLAPAKSFVQSVTPQNPAPDSSPAKQEAVITAYECMLEQATKIVSIDRILENYNRVSKRFNIDKIIQENTIINGISDTAIEVAKLIETYDMPLKARFNTCLETMWYGLHRNAYTFDESELVTTLTDYYMALGENSVACRTMLEGSIVFDKNDYNGDLDVIHDDEVDDDYPLDESKLTSRQRASISDKDYGLPSKRKYPMPDESHVRSAIQMFNHCDSADEAELARNIKKKIKQYGMSVDVGPDNRFSKYYSAKNESFLTDTTFSAIMDSTPGGAVSIQEKVDYQEIMNKFKTSDDADKPNKLKALIHRLYAGSIENSVEELPDLLKYIRGVFVIGGIAIHPVVGAIVFLGDKLLAMHMSREEAIKARNAFKAEIKAVDKKIESCKNDEEKKNLQEYRKEVYNTYQKLDQYYETLLNDEELDKKYDEDEPIDDTSIGSIDIDDDDFKDFDLGDFDFNDDDFGDLEDFGESAKYVALMSALSEAYDNMDIKSFDQAKLHTIIEANPSIATDLYDVCRISPEIISKDALSFAISDVKSDAKIGVTKLDYSDKYDIDNVYRKLGIMFPQSHNTEDIMSEAMRLTGRLQIIMGLTEMYNAAIYKTPLTEASVLNSLKLASEKVKKGLQKLSDKDKTISKNIDVAANNFRKSAERALTSNNREAVIKGSLIPSASKTIKLAILAGGAALIDPAIAVIGVLGYIGGTKALQSKQRQQILDELDVELKMCQKYIDTAESKNDLKALRKLYEIQRNLERQRSKVKYHMNLKGEKYYRKDKISNDGIMSEE